MAGLERLVNRLAKNSTYTIVCHLYFFLLLIITVLIVMGNGEWKM